MKYEVAFRGQKATLYGHEPEEYISSYLAKGTFYEEPLLSYLCDQYPIGLHSVVDVGANIGNHTVFFHEMMGVSQVVAFEPHPRNFYLLKRNAPFALLQQAALGDREGTVSIADQSRNMGACFCVSGGDVPMKTLDSYSLRPDLIKIDAENMEVAVLLGAVETIQRCHPILIVEHHDLQHLYEFGRALKKTGVDYVVRPFLEKTWEVFEYVPEENLL